MPILDWHFLNNNPYSPTPTDFLQLMNAAGRDRIKKALYVAPFTVVEPCVTPFAVGDEP